MQIHTSWAIAATLLLTNVPAVRASPSTSNSIHTPPKQNQARQYQYYILGPGDSLQVELTDIPELSGTFSIGPDGTIYLPRLRSLYVEGLTVEELRYFLMQQYKAYVKSPEIYIRPIGYRPIRIYVGGEVKRPGYYTLRGQEVITDTNIQGEQQVSQALSPVDISSVANPSRMQISDFEKNKQAFPTVFDAIRAAQGITPYSDLGSVEVTRKKPLSAGGGRMKSNLNIMALITSGDEAQNIRLMDNDIVNVTKSSIPLKEQMIKAGRTNLSPQFINIFITGRVKLPGSITMPQGSSLNQAIGVAGGVKILRGKVEFLRFLSDGKTDKRTFSFSPDSPSDSYTNPILASGDIIRVNDSPFSAGLGVINEVAAPLLGIYSVYALTYGAFGK